MKTASQLKIQKVGEYKYLVLYFKYRGDLIRINTKYRYLGEKHHDKDLFYNSSVERYLHANSAIATIKYKVDSYISHQMCQLFPRVNQKECVEIIEKGFEKSKDTLLDHYHKFYKYKETELQNVPSLKDYKSLENALNDFQKSKKTVFKPKDINPQFVLEFRNFLASEHPEKYKTKGNLNNNTIHKRISSLRTFCRYLEENEIANFKEKIYSIETVGKYEPDSVVLSKNEIQQLIDLIPATKFEERIIDLFVLNCYLGLRWSDLSTFEKGRFEADAQGNLNYIKVNEKTDETIVVPVLPTAKRILEKYNYHLPHYTQQYFNRELKKILETHELFQTKTQKKKRQLGKIEPESYLKRELISSHTCRRTFITLCVSHNVPLNSIMLATGHTQLKTLQKYAKKLQNYSAFTAIE